VDWDLPGCIFSLDCRIFPGEKQMDHRAGVFSVPDFPKSRQLPSFAKLFLHKPVDAETVDVGKTHDT
jgi:hypothetical protein